MKIILGGMPHLVGLERAIDVIPGMKPDMLLHAGPPITWDRMCGPMRGAVIGALLYEAESPDRRRSPAARRLGRDQVLPLPRTCGGRADGRHRLAVDAGVRAEERGVWQLRLLHDERGPGQGAALRRLRRAGDPEAQLDGEHALPRPEEGRGQAGEDRPEEHHRPGAAHGRRGPQPQPRRHFDLLPDDRAGHCDDLRRCRRPLPRCWSSSTTTITSS